MKSFGRKIIEKWGFFFRNWAQRDYGELLYGAEEGDYRLVVFFVNFVGFQLGAVPEDNFTKRLKRVGDLKLS